MFFCKYRSILFVWKSNKSLVIDEKDLSPTRLLLLNMTKLTSITLFRVKTYIDLKQL